MIVYHGSTLVVNKPSVSFSKRFLDFGVGFYVTADKVQAENWAKRKAVRKAAKPVVNAYYLSDSLSLYKSLVLEYEDEKWLKFVADCRRGNDVYKAYDYVSGSVANDDVYLTVDMYVRGIWDKDRALSELRYFKTSHQICIINQKMIDDALTFNISYEVY